MNETQDTPSVKQNKLPLILSILLVVSLVASYFIFPGFQSFVKEAYKVLTSEDRELTTRWISQYGFWGPIIILCTMIVQMFLFVIPSIFVMVASVLAYGPLWGTVISVSGIILASSLGYAIGAYFGAEAVSKLIGPKSEKKIAGYIEDYGFWIVIIARLSPLLSNDATSLVGGFLRMGYWRFIGATLIGIMPLAILIAFWSDSIDELKTGLIWFSVISIILFGGYIYFDQKRKHKTGKAQ